jgi:uncharacterized membrane protein
LRPNASLPRRQALMLFVGISAVSLTIATYFALLGGWMVLPFSGGELLLLGGCLYYSLRQCSACEIVIITEQCICIEKGRRNNLERRYEFHRSWAKIILEASVIKGYPSRLVIRSHGKEVEIGRFLVESERKELAVELTKSLTRPIA